MTELLLLQAQFQKYLLSNQSAIHESIVETECVSVDTRLGIYRDAYKLRLIECLTTNFPSLYAYLGTEEFNKLSAYYIAAHPSSFRSIRWYGDMLSDFIKNNYAQYPYLSELADFEWRMSLTFDAADAHIVRVEEMATVPPESWADLRFVLHPSVQRINYFCPAIPLWQALTYDNELPDLQANAKSTAWILWRTPEYTIQFYSLSQEEAWALDSLGQGLTFGAICEGLCQWIKSEEVGMCAASYLKGWIQNGMLSQLHFTE
ncbi:MAG: putative DNA-binding domain-containing protein [Legionella longbeachae]|nr:putative DNA-binding domain-containing protein [Legionella longbeachae]